MRSSSVRYLEQRKVLERGCNEQLQLGVQKACKLHILAWSVYLKSAIPVMTGPNLALLMRSDKIMVRVISFVVFMGALGSEITRAGMKPCFPAQQSTVATWPLGKTAEICRACVHAHMFVSSNEMHKHYRNPLAHAE